MYGGCGVLSSGVLDLASVLFLASQCDGFLSILHLCQNLLTREALSSDWQVLVMVLFSFVHSRWLPVLRVLSEFHGIIFGFTTLAQGRACSHSLKFGFSMVIPCFYCLHVWPLSTVHGRAFALVYVILQCLEPCTCKNGLAHAFVLCALSVRKQLW